MGFKVDTTSADLTLAIERQRGLPMQTIGHVPGSNHGQVLQVCPSWGQQCGIAEYARYVMTALTHNGFPCTVLSTLHDAAANAVANECVTHVFVQHEFAFFDQGRTRLCQGETTHDIIETYRRLQRLRPDVQFCLVAHTYFESAHHRQVAKRLADVGLPVLSLTQIAARRWRGAFVEHGVQDVDGFEPVAAGAINGSVRIGNFGFYPGGRDLETVIRVCHLTKATLVSNFYCSDQRHEALLRRRLESAGTRFEVSFQFLSDLDLLRLMSSCDVLLMPRIESGSWGASGSVRLAMNVERPILINDVLLYREGLTSTLCVFRDPEDAASQILRMRDEHVRMSWIERIQAFNRQNRLADIWLRVVRDRPALTAAYSSAIIHRAHRPVRRPNHTVANEFRSLDLR